MDFRALDIETTSLVPEHPEYALQPFRMRDSEMRITSVCLTEDLGNDLRSESLWPNAYDVGNFIQGNHVWTWNAVFDIGCLIAAGVDCSKVKWLDAMSAMKWIYRSQKTDPPYQNAKRYSWSLANAVRDCLKDWEHYDEFLEIKKEVLKDDRSSGVGGCADYDSKGSDTSMLDEQAVIAWGEDVARKFAQDIDRDMLKNYWLRRCKLDTEATLLLGTQFWEQMSVRQRRGFLIEQEALYPAAESWIRGKLYDFEGAKKLKEKLERERNDTVVLLMAGGYMRWDAPLVADILASSTKCAELLYDYWGVPFYEEYCRTEKGARSVSKKALTFLIEKHIQEFPQIQLVMDCRGMKSKFDKFTNGPLKAREYLGSDYMHHQLRINSTYTGRCTVSSKCKGD